MTVTPVTDFRQSFLCEASTGKTLRKMINKVNTINTDTDKTSGTACLSDKSDWFSLESPIREKYIDTLRENQSDLSVMSENTDATEIDTEWRGKALQVWKAKGKPVIHLGPRENCFDLSELLSRSDLPVRHLGAIKAWLQQHKGYGAF